MFCTRTKSSVGLRHLVVKCQNVISWLKVKPYTPCGQTESDVTKALAKPADKHKIKMIHQDDSPDKIQRDCGCEREREHAIEEEKGGS